MIVTKSQSRLYSVLETIEFSENYMVDDEE